MNVTSGNLLQSHRRQLIWSWVVHIPCVVNWGNWCVFTVCICVFSPVLWVRCPLVLVVLVGKPMFAGLFSSCSLILVLEQFIFQIALGQNGLHVKEVKFRCACSSCDKSPVWNQPPQHCVFLQGLYETSLCGPTLHHALVHDLKQTQNSIILMETFSPARVFSPGT